MVSTVLLLLDITIRRCHGFELYGLKIEPMNLFQLLVVTGRSFVFETALLWRQDWACSNKLVVQERWRRETDNHCAFDCDCVGFPATQRLS